ncbi:MAG: dephospho-CoA kinase [Candidatus Omnitrophica bacterium]|nr:dephospho-CoA kinase [Candidatus Omnitrophota bacterium]
MVIGITGSFGTGKSTVAKIFKSLGAKLIDADKIAHEFVSPYRRRELKDIVFKKKAYLELICKILHPLIISKIKKELKKLNPKKNIIVIDAPLLIETGLDRIVDYLVVVKTKRSIQIERIKKKTGLKEKDILRRIRFQIPLKKKVSLADFVIDNNSSIPNTKKQIIKIWEKITKNLRR